MEQKVDDKGQEKKREADKPVQKVVATRTVDKLLEQSRLSSPGSVRSGGTKEKKDMEGKASSSPAKAPANNRDKKESAKKRKPVRKEKSEKNTEIKDKEEMVKKNEKSININKKEPAKQEKSVKSEEPVKREAELVKKGELTEKEEPVKKEVNPGKGKGAARLNKLGSVGRWFQLLCFMHIPVFGFLYMLVKSLRRKTPEEERHFAIAYILYRILILFLALTILYVLYKVGLQFVDGILSYAGMGN